MGAIKVIDWPYLKKALTMLLLSVLVGVLLVAGSEMFVDNKRDINNASQFRLNEMNASYRDAINQLQLVEDYLPAYDGLVDKGFVGKENRLQWVETLQLIAKQRKLPPIDYDIRPMRPYMPGDGFKTQQFRMFVSEMILKMELQHEQALLQVFSDLDLHMAGKYLIRRCNLQRKSATAARVSGRSGLLAECSLAVYTIKPNT